MDEYYTAMQALPVWLARPMMQLPTAEAEKIHEVRLRAGQKIYVTYAGRHMPISELCGCPPGIRELTLAPPQLEEIFYTLCGGSVHTHQAEIAAGYVTAAGGCRVGVGGRYFEHPEQGVTLQTVRSLNMRIARSRRVELPAQLSRALAGHFTGLLLVGEPGSGKTTLLREIARTLAARRESVAVIDERREIFPRDTAARAADMPPLDVISGLAKGRALQMALRTLGPSAVVFDELGGMDEVAALEQGFFSGVDFVASLHATSLPDALRRPQVQYLKQRQMLHVLVMLSGRSEPGHVREVCFA